MTSDDIANYDDNKKEILANALELFKNGKVVSYKKDNNRIIVKYLLNEKEHEFAYNIEKGVLDYER